MVAVLTNANESDDRVVVASPSARAYSQGRGNLIVIQTNNN